MHRFRFICPLVAALFVASLCASTPAAADVAIFGPKTWNVAADGKVDARESFSVTGPCDGDQAVHTLVVLHGNADGTGQVKKGKIQLNGEDIVDDDELRTEAPRRIEKTVVLRRDVANVLDIELEADEHTAGVVTVEIRRSVEDLVVVVPEKTFILTSSKHGTWNESFAMTDLTGPFSVVLVNGDDAMLPVDDAELILNGRKVIEKKDVESRGNQNKRQIIVKSVTLAIQNSYALKLKTNKTPAGVKIRFVRHVPDLSGPAITLTAPQDGQVVTASPVSVIGTATDPAGVTSLTINGAATAVGADGAFQADVALVAGPNLVVIEAADCAGNVSRRELTITLGPSDTAAPQIAITLPAASSFTKTAIVEASGSATDDRAVSSVSVNGQPATLTGDQWGVTITLSGADGTKTITATAIDTANKQASATVQVVLDTTPPTITAAVTPAPNDAGWSNAATAVTFTCTDATSGVATCTNPVTIQSDVASQIVTGRALDNAGNEAETQVTVKFDGTVPHVAAVVTPAPNADGWNDSDVTVSFDAADSLSGIATVTPPITIATDSASHAVMGTAVDVAGNSASATATVKLDKTAPQITSTVSPLPNAAGWHRTDVTVTFFAADALSGVAMQPQPVTVDTEGATQQAAGTSTDVAGNSATESVSINLDKTAPAIVLATSVPAVVYNTNSLSLAGEVTDPLSGIGVVKCNGEATTLESGAFNCTVTLVSGANAIMVEAADVAGNTAAVTMSIEAVTDTVPPTIVPVVEPRANANGWHNSAVVVDFDCRDEVSGVASCGQAVLLGTEGQDQLIQAEAIDRAGNRAVAVFTLDIDRSAPVLTLDTTPEPGAPIVTKEAAYVIAATVSDVLSGIASAMCNGAPVAVIAERITCTPPVTEGINLVEVAVQDHAGNVTSEFISIERDSTRPRLIVTTPVDEQIVESPDVRVSGFADDASKVAVLRVNGVDVPLDAGRFERTVTLPPGPSVLIIEAQDSAGNQVTKTLSVMYRPPLAVHITSPQDLDTIRDASITVSGTVSNAAEVRVNGVAAALNGSSFTAGSVPLVQGRTVITAVATAADGRESTAIIHVYRDAILPRLTVRYPLANSTVSQSPITVVGSVDDIVVGTINARQVSVTVNDVNAEVTNRSFAAKNIALAPGPNTLLITATDQGGNSITIPHVVVLATPSAARLQIVSGDGQAGEIGTELAQPLVVRLIDAGGAPIANTDVAFRVIENNGTLATSSARGRTVHATTNESGEASARWNLGTRAGAGNNRVEITAEGVSGSIQFQASAHAGPPALLVVDSGDRQFGATGQPLARPLLAVVVDHGSNRLGGVPVHFSVVRGGGTLDGASTRTVTCDSDGRAWVTPTLGSRVGNDGQVFMATVDGLPPIEFVATAQEAGPPAATRISGIVADNSQVPLGGATVRIEGTPIVAQTDAQGIFTLTDVPVGYVKLIIDGSTTARPGTWPMLEYALYTIPGVDNRLEMPIYLLPIDVTRSIMVSEVQGGTLTLPELPGFSLTVAPGSVTFPGGARIGAISATLVHNDRMPMPPGFGQQPRFIVTIQPAGAHFDPPAAITFPNLDGLAPGQITELYSFDHDLGQFVAIGTGSISSDGSVLQSDPGVGIIKAGWHCGGDPVATGTASCFSVAVPPEDDGSGGGGSGGSGADGSLTVTADGATTAPVGALVNVLAGGTPAVGGAYIDWEIFDDPSDPEDDPTAAAFTFAPSCPNQSTCTARVKGLKEGVATVRVTFYNPTVTSTSAGAIASNAVSTVKSPPVKVRFTNVKVSALQFLGARTLTKDVVSGAALFPIGPTQWADSGPLEQEPVWYECAAPDGIPDGVSTGPPNRIRIKVQLRYQQPFPAAKPNVVLEGTGNGLTFKPESGTINISPGVTSEWFEVVANNPFAQETKFYDPLTVTWTLKFGPSGVPFPIGKSANKVYVSLPALGNAAVPLTIVHLAVSNQGASSTSAAFDRTWAFFAGPAGVRTWNGDPLRYYDPLKSPVMPETAFSSSFDLLLLASGQCRSFVDLLRRAGEVNGVRTKPREVVPRGPKYSYMFVKNWDTIGSDSIEGEYVFHFDPSTSPLSLMYPPMPDGIYLQGRSLPGAPGQNTATPGAKVFSNHVVLQLTTVDGTPFGPLYDPSYGMVWTDLLDLENRAIWGYGRRVAGYEYNVFKKVSPMNYIVFSGGE
jgi:hypothetical protein